jgi:copper chaperone CopZ
MTHQYNVSGITCGGCVANVKKALESVAGVTIAVVQREAPQAMVTMEQHIDTAVLQQALKQAGNYQISELQSAH